MFQVVSNNNIIYKPAGKLLYLYDIGSSGDAMFVYNNKLVNAKSNNYFNYISQTTVDQDPFTIFSLDMNGSTVMNMQVILYQTVVGYNYKSNHYQLYVDNVLHDEITLLPCKNNILMFYRIYSIYKKCNNIELKMYQDTKHDIQFNRIDVNYYTLIED